MNFLQALVELQTERCYAIRPMFNKGYLLIEKGVSPMLHWNFSPAPADILVNQYLGEWYTMTREEAAKLENIPGGV